MSTSPLTPVQQLVFAPATSTSNNNEDGSNNTQQIQRHERIQALWKNFGEIKRIHTFDQQLVVKTILLPDIASGASEFERIAHQRKVKSYEVEMSFYRFFVASAPMILPPKSLCPIADLVEAGSFTPTNTAKPVLYLALQDLAAVGFPRRIGGLRSTSVSHPCVTALLRWFARFHAWTCFPAAKASTAQALAATSRRNFYEKHLWSQGSYWHLATRPEEFAALPSNSVLKQFGAAFDREIFAAPSHLCLIHGDSKTANFVASEDLANVAAVDFQYTGIGCGIVDIACLATYICDNLESANSLVRQYGTLLREAFALLDKHSDGQQEALRFSQQVVEHIVQDWCSRFVFAVADYVRFYCGWSGGESLEAMPEWQQQMVAEAVRRVSR